MSEMRRDLIVTYNDPAVRGAEFRHDLDRLRAVLIEAGLRETTVVGNAGGCTLCASGPAAIVARKILERAIVTEELRLWIS